MLERLRNIGPGAMVAAAFIGPGTITTATLAGAMEFARTFNKRREIFGEHKRRLHKHILTVMETEDTPLINDLNLMV